MKNHDRAAANLAQKPLALASLWVEWGSRPGDWVLDAFAGTGTATVAALRPGSSSTRPQQEDIPILVAHDADIAGYEIARTLAEETRTFSRRIKVLDLGLKVAEALGMGLQTEEVVVKHRPSQAL